MLSFGQGWLVLLLDVSVKSLALAIIAAATLAILRVRNTNVRHRVWTAVLFGMMTLPLLVPLTPAVPIPAWFTAKPVVDERPVAIIEVPGDALTAQTAIEGSFGHGQSGLSGRNNMNPASSVNSLDDSIGQSEMMATDELDSADGLDEETAIADAEASLSLSSRLTSWIAENWPALISVAYLAIMSAFFARIGMGLWGTHKIVSRSRPIDGKLKAVIRTRTLSQIVSNPGFCRVPRTLSDIRESDELRVPLTIGFVQPKILLPAGWREWSQAKLQAVLTHESEHIRRGDYFVTLLAEINRAIHWFHPLSWLLRRCLSDLAEQSCDDAVIASTGERTQYARHLLEVASSLQKTRGRLAWSGIAMARKANIESRIDAILDAKRPLARRIGIAGGLLLVATAVSAVLLAAALRPGDPVAANEPQGVVPESVDKPTAKTDESDVKNANEGDRKATTVTSLSLTTDTQVKGQVLDPDGKAKPGATVYVVSTRLHQFMHPVTETILKKVTSDAFGRFDFSVALPERDPRINGRPATARYEKLIAIADGFGPSVVDAIGLRKGDELKLQLTEDDVPIEGRILDLEGQPVVGATLTVAMLRKPRDGIDELLARLRGQAKEKPSLNGSFLAYDDFLDPKIDTSTNERIYGPSLAYPCVALPKAIITDQKGRFQIRGVGRDQMLAIHLAGPNIVSSWLSVISRDMKPIKAPIFIGGRTGMTYGATFTYSAEPSRPIEGVVTDLGSGEPIEGMRVETDHYDAGFVSSITDSKGRYRLDGIPKKKQHDLRVIPSGDQPYFSQRLPVREVAEGLEPTKANISIKRTQWIEGKVTDKATGDPVDARVWFYPLLENKEVKNFASFSANSFRDQESLDFARTDSDGLFRVRATTGKGVLVAKAADKRFRVGVGSEAIGSGKRGLLVYDGLYPMFGHVFRVVNVPNRREPLSVDLQVDPGVTLAVRLQDQAGKPLIGVRVMGRQPDGFDIEQPLATDAVEIQGIDPTRPRAVFFYHPKRNLGAFLLANQQRSGQQTVKLLPCGTLKGRLLAKHGKPMANMPVGIRSVMLSKRKWSFPIAKTDKEGRFETKRFIPAARFNIHPMAFAEQERIGGTIEVQPGKTLDLGEVTLQQTPQIR